MQPPNGTKIRYFEDAHCIQIKRILHFFAIGHRTTSRCRESHGHRALSRCPWQHILLARRSSRLGSTTEYLLGTEQHRGVRDYNVKKLGLVMFCYSWVSTIFSVFQYLHE